MNTLMLDTAETFLPLSQMLLLACLVLREPLDWCWQLAHAQYAASFGQVLSSLHCHQLDRYCRPTQPAYFMSAAGFAKDSKACNSRVAFSALMHNLEATDRVDKGLP